MTNISNARGIVRHHASPKGNRLNRILIVTFVLLGAACTGKQETKSATSGDPAKGKQLITQYGCTACHSIPGIDGPRGEVGPSLDHVAVRPVIAGTLPNNMQNLTQYLLNPQIVNTQNIMPNLGIKPDEARDIAAYLYTLK
jgi:cytochrome c2